MLHKSNNKNIDGSKDKDEKKFLPFIFGKLRSLEIIELYIGAIFLCFPRIILGCIILIVFYPFQFAFYIFHNPKKENSIIKRLFMKILLQFYARCLLICFGVFWISKRKEKITNFKHFFELFCEEEKLNYKTNGKNCIDSKESSTNLSLANTLGSSNSFKKKIAPIIIVNHTSFLDPVVISSQMLISFVAKKDVKNLPIYGTLARIIGTIFVDRFSKDNRESALEGIKLRANQILSHKNFSPICIFPEGVRTNSSYLIKFQRGSFQFLHPIKIVAIKYNRKNGNLFNGIYPLMKFFNNLTLTSFDYVDPFELNIEKPEDFELFSRTLMSKTLNIEKMDVSFKDYVEFKKLVKEKSKKNKKTQIHNLETLE